MPSHLRTSRSAFALAAALLLGAVGTGARADDFSDRFTFQGYGYQHYLQSTKNDYLGAGNQGTWDENFLGLVLSATVTDKSKLWAQFQGSAADGTRFTWFFLDYQLSDNLRAHLGRVKMPLGFYNEIIDVKSLQLSALEPTIYQGAADMVHDAYHGVGFDYEQDLAGGHVLWQAWGGNAYDVDPPDDSRDRRAFGLRATYRTPIDGLRLMLSGYRTRVELLADQSMSNEDRVLAGAEYVKGNWDLKAEYAKHKFMGVKSHGYYVQAGYTLADKWMPYLRYDDYTSDTTQRSDPSYYQKTAVAGLGYKFDPNIGLRLEVHANRGYALPVASGEVAAGAGANRWTMLVAGVNFSF